MSDKDRSDLAKRNAEAAFDSKKPIVEHIAHDAHVRENMQRLRALRLAKEAAEGVSLEKPSPKKHRRSTVLKSPA